MPLSIDSSYVVCKTKSSTEGRILRMSSDGRIGFFVFPAMGPRSATHTLFSPEILVLGKWYHVAGVYDGSIAKIFVDGVEKASRVCSGSIGTSMNPLRIGIRESETFRDPFHGMIDELRISNVARYSSDFLPPMELVSDQHTAALWHFNEGSGNTVYGSSGNGNHGTIHGATWVER